MFDLIGVPPQALFGQLLLGLINGSFYALLSLGLAVIFGLLNIINFAHGAQYMLGAFAAYLLLNNPLYSIGYWPALILAPLIVGGLGMLLERNLISQLNVRSKTRPLIFIASFVAIFLALAASHLSSGAVPDLVSLVGYKLDPAAAYGIAAIGALLFTSFLSATNLLNAPDADQNTDHLYGLLLTFGLAIIIQGLFVNQYGSSGLPYTIPDELRGGQNLGFMFLPIYRGWVIVASLVVCIATWLIIEKTKLGAYLRAATENPTLLSAFGVNVPRLVTFTYGFGVALAGLAGVLAAPIYSVNPNMGADLIIVVFAVVVIGGMGSILGAIVTGFMLGIVEGLTKVFYPEAASVVIFVIMAIVLLIKPAGLFGRTA
ncbi:ABC transporter permease [Rhodomicrobium udaipurense JA643]|uniref:Branched-chain amino acid ABC transporter permease n=1 Tax=Rhodomicrobium udaipurense TaxID=1202716 RepID=A0A8I1GEL8_9HYPH|nr:branched-chain amino acid ABC transporter permease [Rhodomicrobium udaipurense]KAI93491.1 ABC transporter permease [Rhodomicrobium udaipurense JA643]MBJ7543544.1 branched-chain amino acid ABC transporter permease [Rhodomicrobium udaipurense]